MQRYSKEFKTEALKLSDEIGVKKAKCKQEIADMLKKKPKSMQLSLFSDEGFAWR